MKRAVPCITLTTDFGTADGYAGAIKGRLLAMVPRVPVVDITHDIAPQAVMQGAWCLRRAARTFPPGTVHVAVVDPEVGSWRSALVVETEQNLLVGPDNGVLSLAAREGVIRRVIEIVERPGHWTKSASFDGLTLFAPVAAHLANGLDLDSIGTELEDLVTLPEPLPERRGFSIMGQVLFWDRFGNCITNIAKEHIGQRPVERIFLRTDLEVLPCEHYAQLAGKGRIGGLWNSDGRLELALFGESLRDRLSLKAGEPVKVLLKPT